MTNRLYGATRIVATLTVLAGISMVPAGSVHAQSAACFGLEQDLAAYDRSAGGGNVQRIERAYQKQYDAYQRAESRAVEIGCRKQGFLFFQPKRPAECRGLDAQINNMAANLEALAQQRDQLLSGGNDAGRQRILQMLAQNRCGVQYEQQLANAPSGGGGFFDGWFNSEDQPPADQLPNSPYYGVPGGGLQTYRTVCVRQCDGYFFPINFATTEDRFDADAGQCQAMCPSAPVELYIYENPGSSMENAISLAGEPYANHPNAFVYQKEYVRGCSCNQYTLKLHEREAERSTMAPDQKLPVPGPDTTPAPPPAEKPQQQSNAAPAGNEQTSEENQSVESATIIGLPQQDWLTRPEEGEPLAPLPTEEIGEAPLIMESDQIPGEPFQNGPGVLSTGTIPEGSLVAGQSPSSEVEIQNGVRIIRPGAPIIGERFDPGQAPVGEPLVLDPSRGQ